MFIVQYDEKLCHLLDTYDKLFIVHADNVGSKQFQDIRRVSQHTPGNSLLEKQLPLPVCTRPFGDIDLDASSHCTLPKIC